MQSSLCSPVGWSLIPDVLIGRSASLFGEGV